MGLSFHEGNDCLAESDRARERQREAEREKVFDRCLLARNDRLFHLSPRRLQIAQLRQRIAVLEASARGGAEPRSPTEAASSPSTGLAEKKSPS